MPTPQRNESREKFVARCMKHKDASSSDLTQEQKLGRCFGIYKSSKSKKHTKKSHNCNGLTCQCDTCLKDIQAHLYKTGAETYARVQLDPQEIATNDKEISAECILGSSNRDWQYDKIEMSGVDTRFHQFNPIVMWVHGRAGHTFPIGKTETPNHDYTVHYHDESDILSEKTYFVPDDRFALQVYKLIKGGFLRANSIALKNLQVAYLPPDPERGFLGKGKHILKSYLTECSWTPLGGNPDAVLSLVSDRKIEGERLDDVIYKSFLDIAPPRKTQINGFTEKSEVTAKSHTKGTTDMTSYEREEEIDRKLQEEEQEREQQAQAEEDDTSSDDDSDEESESDPTRGSIQMRSAYDLLAAVRSDIQGEIDEDQPEPVRDALQSAEEQIAAIIQNLAEVHNSQYPDEDALSPEPDSVLADTRGEKADYGDDEDPRDEEESEYEEEEDPELDEDEEEEEEEPEPKRVAKRTPAKRPTRQTKQPKKAPNRVTKSELLIEESERRTALRKERELFKAIDDLLESNRSQR